MAKGGKKTAKKGTAAKRSAPPAQGKQTTKEAAQGPIAPKNGSFCMTASSWGTSLSLLPLGTIVFLYWVTQSERCSTLSYWEPVWGALEKYGIASRPTDVVLANVCTTIHDVTRSCLFLSGGVTSAQSKAHNSVSHAWERLQSVWGGETASHASALPEVLYERDQRDVLFAVTWGIVLLALRGVLMRLVLLPSARLLVQRPPPQKMAQIGHRNKYHRSIDRFAEQFWIAILYSTSLVLVLVRIPTTHPVRCPPPALLGVEARAAVDRLPPHDDGCIDQGRVPLGSLQLHPPALCAEHRGAPLRPCADDGASYCHAAADWRLLRLLLLPCGTRHSFADGPERHFAGGTCFFSHSLRK